MNNIKYINVHKEAVRQTCVETIDLIQSKGEPSVFMQIVGFKDENDETTYTLSFSGDNSFLTKLGVLEYMKHFILNNSLY